MAAIETAFRRQKAVLWPLSSIDGYGEATTSTPIELLVRWVDKKDRMKGPNGEDVETDAQVVVDRDIAIGSLMWLGALVDWTGSGEVAEVVAKTSTPSLKGTRFRRIVGLRRYKTMTLGT